VSLGPSIFDGIADIYDRVRPRYTPELFDDLISLADIPEHGSILEIGCGTGQATMGLAGRGYRIVCLEPGARLAALARRNLAGDPGVAVVEEHFESWSVDPATFDLIVAARAIHWITREIRFTKPARLLRPGGAMAIVNTCPAASDSPLMRAIQAAYARHAPSLVLRPDAVDRDLREEFVAAALFRILPTRTYRWSRRYSDREYVDLLRTHSSHIVLPPRQRSALLQDIGEAIATHGGSLDVEYVERLTIGRLDRQRRH
jgi:SAM-dependent methyltransferase